MFRGEETNTNVIVVGLTWPRLQSTIVVGLTWPGVQSTIYHIRGEHYVFNLEMATSFIIIENLSTSLFLKLHLVFKCIWCCGNCCGLGGYCESEELILLINKEQMRDPFVLKHLLKLQFYTHKITIKSRKLLLS
jgi:hypothetical protein